MSRSPRFLPLLLLPLLAACDRAPEPTAAAPRPVLTQVVRLAASEPIGPFVGTIQPRYQTVRSFQLPGRVLSRDVSVGDRVTTGQELARLDSTTQEFQLASAQADVANAQAQFRNLAAAEERARALAEAGTAAPAQLDAATTARETASAQLAQAEANLKRAEDQVSYARIIAEFDGVVVAVGAEVGEVVSAGQPILTIARPAERDAVFDVPEALAGTLATGDSITVTTTDASDESATGTVREIAPVAEGVARTRRVRITLTDPPDIFRLGATIEARWERTLPAPVAVVPAAAILTRDGAEHVWVADPASQTVALRRVAVARGGNGAVSITEGVADGDRVVVAGVNSLTEGQTVSVGSGDSK